MSLFESALFWYGSVPLTVFAVYLIWKHYRK